MFINGIDDYDQQGNAHKTGLIVSRANGAAEVRTTNSGKRVASLSLRAYGRKDGTCAFVSVKSWDEELIDQMSFIAKGDKVLAAGRISFRDYNGKTYVDMLADILTIQRSGEAMNSQAPAKGLYSVPEDEDDGDLPF